MRLYSLIFAIIAPLAALFADVSEKFLHFTGNIQCFNTIFPQEKVYLELDNTAYFQGEIIWFKAYVVHATTNERAPSKVLYVDFLSPDGVILQQHKLKIIAGQADGNFSLKDISTPQARNLRGILNYSSGFYEIRAYTMNMLNFNPEIIFSRVIPVLKKPYNDGDFASSATQGVVVAKTPNNMSVAGPRPPIESTAKTNIIKNDNTDNELYSLDFFPEGGDAIVGLPCRVAFKATNSWGIGIEGTLRIDEVNIKTQTVANGMGFLEYIPTKEKQSAIFENNGILTKVELPKAVTTGYSMKSIMETDQNLTLLLQRTPEYTDDTLGITVVCRGDIADFRLVAFDKDSISLTFNTYNWPVGVCRITLFTKQGEIMASRTVFCGMDRIKTPNITMESDKDLYSPFDSIKLSFKLTDSMGNPFKDRFCLSVRDATDYGSGLQENLLSNLLLSSDLKGYIENARWYFDRTDSIEKDKRRIALDLLCLIHGWERYEWRTMAGIEPFKELHRIEENLTLNGWILSRFGRKPMKDIKVGAAVVPKDKSKTELFSVTTTSNGYFGFNLSDFEDKAQLTINLMSEKGNNINARIKLERSIIPEPRSFFNAEILLAEPVLKREELRRVKAENKKKSNEMTMTITEYGILLSDVDIEEEREYIDYNTFKSHNAEKDTEIEIDKGEYSTDLFGYLLNKGYDIYLDQEVYINPENFILFKTDGEAALDMANVTQIGGSKVLWYVHDSKQCRYKGSFIPAWSIDMCHVKSVIIFDKAVSLFSIRNKIPLLLESTKKQIDLDSYLKLNGEFADSRPTNYYLIDVLLKEDYEIESKREILNLGRRVTDIEGYSKITTFQSPIFPDTPSHETVDYRRTIYWNPNVITDKEGMVSVAFRNNSFSNAFKITCTGITAGGIPYVFDTNY
ncbi:MAG TPA: hypothetical protein VFC94_00190 [Bacteroidaceae bacterium]|nr:hypothetical protein [Bacteroidaceae bacterium]